MLPTRILSGVGTTPDYAHKITVKMVLKAVIIFAKIFKKVFTGNNFNSSSCLNILQDFNFPGTDSLIQMCAKFLRMIVI